MPGLSLEQPRDLLDEVYPQGSASIEAAGDGRPSPGRAGVTRSP